MAEAPNADALSARCADALREAGAGSGAGLTARCDGLLSSACEPRERALALDTVALIAQRHGWFIEARRALAEIVARDPSRRVELAALLARGWSFEAALDALGDAPEDPLLRADLLARTGRAEASLAVLLAAPTSDAVSMRLLDAGRPELAVSRDPDGLVAATLALWRGDLDDAERIAARLDAATILGAVRALRGDLDGALASLDRAIARDPRDAEARCWRAEALLRAGRADEALDEARRAGEASPEFTQYVPALLLRYRAEVALGRPVQLPEGALVDSLRALLPHRAREIAALLPGAAERDAPPRSAEVAELLDTALASLESLDATRWLRAAIQHLRAGRFEEARAEAARVAKLTRQGDAWVAAEVVAQRCDVATGRFTAIPRGPLSARLAALAPGHARTLARATEPAPQEDRATRLASMLDEALAALGGNRSFLPMFVRGGAMQRLPVDDAPRRLAKESLWRVVVDGDDAALDALSRVVDRFPARPEPHLYVGELHLWFGRWELARRAFERARAMQRHTRWAWIGLGAAALGEGDVGGALETFERGVRVAGGVGPTLFVYRGEARWRAGDLSRAREDLAHACRINPTRIAAWMLLALVADAQGDAACRASSAREARARAPGLVGDAADACGATLPSRRETLEPELMRAVFGAALSMMRGNRSSNQPTYLLPDGRLRVATLAPDDAADRVLLARADPLDRGRSDGACPAP